MDIIKRNTDYALRLMARLARYGGAQAVSARRLAEEEDVSLSLASKLLQQLSDAGFVQSRMGKRGGFFLSKPPSEIRLADLIAAIQGPLRFNRCTIGGQQVCPHQDRCRICDRLKDLQQWLNHALTKITLSELVR